MPAPANVPGQIGWGQLLDTVKVQPSEILNRRANIGTKANTLEVADASMGWCYEVKKQRERHREGDGRSFKRCEAGCLKVGGMEGDTPRLFEVALGDPLAHDRG